MLPVRRGSKDQIIVTFELGSGPLVCVADDNEYDVAVRVLFHIPLHGFLEVEHGGETSPHFLFQMFLIVCPSDMHPDKQNP